MLCLPKYHINIPIVYKNNNKREFYFYDPTSVLISFPYWMVKCQWTWIMHGYLFRPRHHFIPYYVERSTFKHSIKFKFLYIILWWAEHPICELWKCYKKRTPWQMVFILSGGSWNYYGFYMYFDCNFIRLHCMFGILFFWWNEIGRTGYTMHMLHEYYRT